MRVYRVQNHKNWGAYNSLSFVRRGCEKHPNPHLIKSNIADKGFNDQDFYYGFRNLKQLKRWFSKKDRIGLDRDDYFLSVYEVPKEYCFCDQYQAAFYLKKAKFIRDLDLARHIK